MNLNDRDNRTPSFAGQRHIQVSTVENGWAISWISMMNSPFTSFPIMCVAETPERLSEILLEWAKGHRAPPAPPAGERTA